jgi:hypothetical protein
MTSRAGLPGASLCGKDILLMHHLSTGATATNGPAGSAKETPTGPPSQPTCWENWLIRTIRTRACGSYGMHGRADPIAPFDRSPPGHYDVSLVVTIWAGLGGPRLHSHLTRSKVTTKIPGISSSAGVAILLRALVDSALCYPPVPALPAAAPRMTIKCDQCEDCGRPS